MLLGDCIQGRFVLEAVIGEGGMGTVYRALDLETDRRVAVKVILVAGPEGAERFRRESALLAELHHPHVVRWLGHGGDEDGHPYLAMEWLDGEDLADRLARGPLSTRDAVRLGTHVAEALAAVHALGILHRDIKPENLYLQHHSVDEVRVLDFGIAKSERFATLTRAGLGLGTIGFMAPEQIAADRAVGPWTDVFSLGCVLYEALTGRLPFTGPNPMAVLLKITLDDAPRVRDVMPSVPAALDDLVARMLERDVARRVGSAEELLNALQLIEATAGPLSSEPEPRPALTTTERRIVSLIVAGGGEEGRPPEIETALVAAVRPFGASLETLAGELVVAVLTPDGTPHEQVGRAAACALALRVLLPDAPMVLVTDLEVGTGPLIDRAVVQLASAPRRGVVIDALSASLVGDRFEVTERSGDAGLVLVGARTEPGSVRLLLGQPTPCIGRERDVATLTATFDQCVDEETSRIALVTGAPGLGKSRLVSEVLRSIGLRGELTLLEGRGDAVTPGVTFGILGAALRGAAGIGAGAGGAERVRTLVCRALPSDEASAIAPFIGEIAGVPFDDSDDATLRAARSDPRIMASWTHRALVRWLDAECAVRPVVLVLEDLHWADGFSVRLVEQVAVALADRRFMVLATARPEVFDRFPNLRKSRAWNEHALGGLSKRAAQRLARAVLGEDVAAETIASLVERADGNPYFLEELLRHAAECRPSAVATTLPTSLIGVMHARLDALEPDTRRLLRAASILGATFSPGAVAHLTGEPPVTIARHIAVIVDGELALRPGGAEVAFRHAIVREVAYATLTDDDRRLGHRLAAEWLETTGAAPAVIAAHFEHGAEPRRAAAWYERAGRAALEANDFDGALGAAERGLACAAAGDASPGGSIGPGVVTRLRLLKGRVLRWKLEVVAATDALQAAYSALPPGSRDWFIAASDLLTLVSRRHMLALSREVAAAMIATPCLDPADASWRASALARAALQHALMELGLLDGLLDAAREAVRVLPGPDPYVTAQLQSAEAAHNMFASAPGDALRASRAASATYQAIGDKAALLTEGLGVVSALCQLGLFAEAEAVSGPWIDEAMALGLPFVAIVIRSWRARASYQRGDAASARRDLGMVVQAMGKVPYAGTAHAQLALIALDEGALDEAESAAAAGLALSGGLRAGRAWSLACLARIALARGRGDEARAHAVAALQVVLAGPNPYDLAVSQAYVEVHYALGEPDAADRQLAVACALIRERAEHIDEPTWRDAYLAVPDVRALLALGAARGL